MLAVDVSEFDFDLPQELIAKEPRPERTSERLLYLNRRTGDIRHSTVADLPQHLDAGDVLVVNNTCVFPARLIGRRVPSGGIVECLLIRRVGVDSESTQSRVEVGRTPTAGDTWEALMHPGQKLRVGAQVVFDGRPTIHGEVLERRFFGRRVIRLWTDDGSPIDAAIDKIGHVPLP